MERMATIPLQLSTGLVSSRSSDTFITARKPSVPSPLFAFQAMPTRASSPMPPPTSERCVLTAAWCVRASFVPRCPSNGILTMPFSSANRHATAFPTTIRYHRDPPSHPHSPRPRRRRQQLLCRPSTWTERTRPQGVATCSCTLGARVLVQFHMPHSCMDSSCKAPVLCWHVMMAQANQVGGATTEAPYRTTACAMWEAFFTVHGMSQTNSEPS